MPIPTFVRGQNNGTGTSCTFDCTPSKPGLNTIIMLISAVTSSGDGNTTDVINSALIDGVDAMTSFTQVRATGTSIITFIVGYGIFYYVNSIPGTRNFTWTYSGGSGTPTTYICLYEGCNEIVNNASANNTGQVDLTVLEGNENSLMFGILKSNAGTVNFNEAGCTNQPAVQRYMHATNVSYADEPAPISNTTVTMIWAGSDREVIRSALMRDNTTPAGNMFFSSPTCYGSL